MPRRFVLALNILLLSSSVTPAHSRDHVTPRNIALDSIAWVQQEIPIPGVIAGNAIWFDYNGDGRLDILMAGMSEAGPISGIYRNYTTGFTNIEAAISPLISERGLAWGDLDNDGDLDFAIEGRTDGTGNDLFSIVYRNDSGSFVDLNAQIMNLNGGSITWIDSDNDGHLDLLISGSPDGGNSYYTKLYRFIGGQFYEVPTNFPGVWGSSIVWSDYDQDGYVDVVISGYGFGAQTRLFHNAMSHGVIGFDEVYNPLGEGGQFEAVNSSGLIWFDYDNDGFVDLLVTGAGPGGPVAALYHNNQDGIFTNVPTGLQGVSVSAVAVGDYDNDGYLDIAISGADDFWTGSSPTTKIYHNNEGSSFTDIGAALIGTWFGSLDWGDYDGDGRLDLLVTGATIPRSGPSDGSDLKPVTVLYRNTVSIDGNVPPSTPQGLAVQVTGQDAVLRWDPATDNETAQKAISYNIMVGTEPGGFDVVSPLSDPESGFRRLPKPGTQGTRVTSALMNLPQGTYYWKVQAIDNQYAGSSFSEEHIFTVTSSSAGNPSTPVTFSLQQNFPNPFNPTTTIEYSVGGIRGQGSGVGSVRLIVYDMLGREVRVVVDEKKPAGRYEAKFDGAGLASGVYLYRLTAGNDVQARTMVLLR